MGFGDVFYSMMALQQDDSVPLVKSAVGMVGVALNTKYAWTDLLHKCKIRGQRLLGMACMSAYHQK